MPLALHVEPTRKEIRQGVAAGQVMAMSSCDLLTRPFSLPNYIVFMPLSPIIPRHDADIRLFPCAQTRPMSSKQKAKNHDNNSTLSPMLKVKDSAKFAGELNPQLYR